MSDVAQRAAAADGRSLPLAGQPALVTGAGRGIGRAIAQRLAAAGAPVCLAARSQDELEDVAGEIEANGGRAVAVPCDVTAPEAVEQLVDTAARAMNGLALLVNNAGGAHRVAELDRLAPADFDLGTSLNYGAVYRSMHAAAPHLFRAAPGAAVLNVVSIAADRGLAGMSYYSGAKAAVAALSRAVAREWGPRGVRVNCLAPGWIVTELSRPLRASPEFTEKTLAEIPLGDWGAPEDIAEAALFLLSDAARYITGTTLHVDGGLLA